MAVKKRLPAVDAPRLRAVTAPVDTMSRPAPPELLPDAPVRSDLARLATSLGSFSEQLGEWGKAHIREQGRFGESEALGLRLRTTTEELGGRIRSGDIPQGVNVALLNMGHGEDLARENFQDIRRRYMGESTSGDPTQSNAFDRNSGNLDAWFKQVTQEYEGRLPQNPYAQGSWRRMIQGYQEQLYGEHDRYLQQRTTNANLDAAHKDIYGLVTTAITEGERDPAAIHGRIQGAFGRTSQLYQLTPDQTNAAIFGVARSIAEQGIPGNPMLGVALVREMLLGKRGDLPPLGNSHQYAHLSNQVIEAANKTAGELQRKLALETVVSIREDAVNGRLDEQRFVQFTNDNPHILSERERESIMLQNRTALEAARAHQRETVDKLRLEAQSQANESDISNMLLERGQAGTLLTIPEKVTHIKKNGETGEYSRRNLLDRAAEEELRRIDEWSRQQQEIEREVQDAGATPPPGPTLAQRKFDREYDFFNRNQLVHPQWRDLLASGYAAASPEQLASNAPAPVLLQSVQLFEDLQTRSPGLLERHMQSNNARDFYSTYRVARTLMRQDERQALLTAALATKNLGSDDAHAVPFKKIDEQLSRANSVWPWAQDVTNFGDMREDVRRLSKALVRGGMSPEDAVRAAGDEALKQYTNINGYMLKTSDRHIEAFGTLLRTNNLQPRTFEDTAKRFLAKYATTEGPESASGRKLSLRPTTEGVGVWAVIDPATGLPVPSTNGMRQVISLRDLLEFERVSQVQERDRVARELLKKRDDGPDGPASIGGDPAKREPRTKLVPVPLPPLDPAPPARKKRGRLVPGWPEDDITPLE